MIKKECKPNYKMLQTEALLRRVSTYHNAWRLINRDYGRMKAGYKGEKSLDYFLEFMPFDDYFLFHDIRLTNNHKQFFQMDVLLVTPYFITIMEVKNIRGCLYFDHLFDQMIRTYNNEREAFPDPINQVLFQEKQLRTWLEQKRIPALPIESMVVMCNSSTVIEFSPEYQKHLLAKIVRKRMLLTALENFNERHTELFLPKKEMRKLASLLHKHHTEDMSDIKQKYELNSADILHGVQCSTCLTVPLHRKLGSWYCSSCNAYDKEAHFAAFMDFKYLLKSEISNADACDFLQLSSSSTSKHLLKSMNWEKHGVGRSVKYVIKMS